MRPVASLLLLATAVVGQATPAPPREPTPAQRAARFARELELPERRRAAIDGLLALGAPAVDALLTQARHPELAVAHVALQVLVELGHDGLAAVPRLQAAAAGKDAHARAAAWALARLPHRGTFLVPSMDEGVVRELDADGKEIWQSAKVGKPWSATKLANGNLLVADIDGAAREYDDKGTVVWEWLGKHVYTAERLLDGNTLCTEFGAQRVVEVDARGEEVWSHRGVQTLFARRLPHGTTFLGDFGAGTILEVARDGTVVWSLDDCQNTYAAQRLRDGNILSRRHNVGPATVRDKDGKELRTIPTRDQGSEVLLLPDGSIQCGQNYVLRCNADGSERWAVKIAGWVGHVTLR